MYRTASTNHLLLQLFSAVVLIFGYMAAGQNSTIPVDVGVAFDVSTVHGKIGLSCIDVSLSDFYATRGSSYKTRLILHTRDSQGDEVDAAAAAVDLIKNQQVQAIIGPENSMQADFVIDLGDKAQVPILSFSATSPSLRTKRSPYFIRAARNDSAQVKAISALVQAHKWKQAVLMYVDNEFGEGIIPSLTDALEEVDTRVPYRSVISPSASDDQILEELYKLMTMQTRVFILHMLPPLGDRIFVKAQEIGMMNEGYVWIMTTGITDLLSSVDPSVVTGSMQGILGVQTYVLPSQELENFTHRWKMKFQRDNPAILNPSMNIFGLWAYDATRALAMAIEEIGATNFSFNKVNVSSTNATDLDRLGFSVNGHLIREALVNTTFIGLTGDFILSNGELHPSTFQIVNINGNAARSIGYWTEQSGLLKDLKSGNSGTYNTSSSNLATIIWPGDPSQTPKGWEIPTNGKRLRIGVPVKEGFGEFVRVTKDKSTNMTTVDGYCIRVFDAVMAALPYSILYDFIPFVTPDGNSTGNYNDLVYQVFLRNFDAVVGDVTIVANRSQYVDFTLPYTESGVSMVVPYRDNKSKNAWVFLKPLTWDLWLTSGCFFFFIGLVVWILEHRINDDFRGPVSHQVGTSCWFSFSTMVFSHRERVLSNSARFVVIVWICVVLILTQSYTASLTSLLTVQQLQPTVTSVNELLKKGETVGYLDGSFVYGILKAMNFDDKKLKAYNSPDELDELFSKGSANGGIAAAFDEVPYLKLFLGKYCSKYTMVAPTFKTAGFGFVFPLGSPLVSDVSRAILNVTEGPQMAAIEVVLSPQADCPDSSTSLSSNSLSLDSFWGLFLIAGVAAFIALFIFTVKFLKSNWDAVERTNSGDSFGKKLAALARRFIQRDLSSHTIRKGGFRNRDIVDVVHDEGSPSNYPPSSSESSNYPGFELQMTPPNNHHYMDAVDVEQGSPKPSFHHVII